MVVWFSAQVNFYYCLAASKNDTFVESGKKCLENNQLASLILITPPATGPPPNLKQGIMFGEMM